MTVYLIVVGTLGFRRDSQQNSAIHDAGPTFTLAQWLLTKKPCCWLYHALFQTKRLNHYLLHFLLCEMAINGYCFFLGQIRHDLF